MLPLNTITNSDSVNNPSQLASWFQQLKSVGVDGVMADVWWGIVEKSPRQYSWNAYQQLWRLCQNAGLTVQATISFHSCGGNINDDCNIPLPAWAASLPNVLYLDQSGQTGRDYLTWGVDLQPIFPPGGRTAVQMYSDFLTSFRETFRPLLRNTIVTVEVGLGPAGELRYPSYKPDSFPGVGAFQCYDTWILKDLQAAATAAGHPEWGRAGPNNAGSYYSTPDSTGFFNPNCACDNYKSPYGQFFLDWYSSRLVQHGERVLTAASNVFSRTGVELTAKISGVHWLYFHPSHAAELTAGYKNDQLKGYDPFAKMFNKLNVTFTFTALEMRDNQQPPNCLCAPEELVGQTKSTCLKYRVRFAGENALPCFDSTSYNQILYEARRILPIDAFTYLRLGSDLFSGNNLATFQGLVNGLHNLPPPE